MSYKPPEPSGDSLNDYFRRLSEFNRIAPNLLNCKSSNEFECWFEQAELIDKRALYLFIKRNYRKIPIEYLEMIKYRFDSSFKKD